VDQFSGGRSDALVRITESHRELWQHAFERPELAAVTRTDENAAASITSEERLFVGLLISHVQTVFEAQRLGVLPSFWGRDWDVAAFFARPIPRAIWGELRELQNPAFRHYVDGLIEQPAALRRRGA